MVSEKSKPEVIIDHCVLATCRNLHLPESDRQEIFRRMVFNHLANNTDGHNKNFTFIMTSDSQWKLSPAYGNQQIAIIGRL